MKTKLLGVFAAAALVFAVAAYGQEGPPTPLRGGVLDAHQKTDDESGGESFILTLPFVISRKLY